MTFYEIVLNEDLYSNGEARAFVQADTYGIDYGILTFYKKNYNEYIPIRSYQSGNYRTIKEQT